ncbi:hypothetical protein BDR26DRAFT_421669 [Obelidium mucronatum]|nr:hypothetical protein BDR26DRAFT_421669 [Obelidium mucronatum]
MMSYTSTASVVGVTGDTVGGGGSGFFDYSYLQSTLTAYAIGITISLVINILFFPDTAENHLNKNLTALFSKLCELSSCIITCLSNTNPSREDYRSELSKRTHLVAGIQTLFGAIDAELEHVAAEIMYSHFSLADYSRLVKSCKSVAAVLFSMNTVLDSPDSVTLLMSKDYEGNISEDMKIVWREFRDSVEAMFDGDGVQDADEKSAATNDEKVVNIVDAFKRAGYKAVSSFRNHQPHLFARIFDNNYGNLNHSMEPSTKEAKKSWEKLLQINYYTLAMREFIEELVELQKQREIFNKARCRIRLHINWYIPPATVLNNLKLGTSFALSRRTIRAWAVVLKNMLLSSNSIYGFKVATAIICLQMIMYSIPGIYKSWYMSGCVGTIVVAITPSMGQTFFGVPLTILGTSFGNSLAFASVSLFGADSYGHLVFCLITGVLFCYIPVFSPQHSALGLLTLLAFANFVCITYVKKDDTSFETPSIHLSKVISVTSIALPFSVLFTLVIYPTLARHVLRKRLSSIFDDLNMFYCKIMTSSIRESAPSLQPLLSLNEEDSDLKTLRNKIFSNIVALDPLMTYTSSEPRIQGRFPSETYYEVIQIMYALLDRLECCSRRRIWQSRGQSCSRLYPSCCIFFPLSC